MNVAVANERTDLARHPVFHRWNGRTFAAAALIGGITGLVMMWTRGTVGDLSQHIGISLNAAVIVLCVALAVRHARARNFAAHRRWALRLFLTASGVWFFRVGLMFWVVVNGGPVGFDPKAFVGPFLTFLAFAQYLLPLAVLELYFRAQERAGAAMRYAVSAAIFLLTIATAVGIVGASMGMWLPRMGL